jgi:hypothetical protein
MRKRIYIPSLILLVAALIILLMRQKQESPLPKTKSEVGESTGSVSQIATVMPKPTNQLQNLSPSQTSHLSTVNDREKTNEIRQYMESQNKPVDFYGRAIDQDGNPLAGVRVKGQVLHLKVVVPAPWGDQDEIIPIEKETDSDGQFEVRGMSGRSFDIDSIQKGGYETEPWRHVRSAAEGSFENPVVFKLWSTNLHEQLITGEKSFEILPDGKPHVIVLAKGTMAETGDGDLKIWIQYTNQVVQGRLYDWSAGIEVINGGLLEEPYGSVMYIAPTEGYVPSFVLQQQIKGGQSGEIGDRSFYLMLRNGHKYGRMNINLYAPYGYLHPGLIRLSYAINPSGSRVLR